MSSRSLRLLVRVIALCAPCAFAACHAESRTTSPKPVPTPSAARTTPAPTGQGGEGELEQLALAASPSRVLVASGRDPNPVSKTWTAPRDGCFRVFARAAAVPEAETSKPLRFGSFSAPVLSGSTPTALPKDGPFCAKKGAALPVVFEVSRGTLEWVVVGSAESP